MNITAIPARVLAALIDYFVVKATASILLPGSISGFFLIAGIYFTAGNSSRLGGASIGKRLFGLKVKDLAGGEGLNVWQSFLRFFFLYGIIILVAEVPAYFYRQSALVAPLALLDLHLFFSLAYFLSLLALVIASKSNRGTHDFICSSYVERAEEKSDLEKESPFEKRPLGGILIACSVSLLLWLISASKAPEAETVLSHRYELEREFGLEIVSADYQQSPSETLYIRCISHEKLSKEEQLSKLTALSNHILEDSSTNKGLKLHYIFLDFASRNVSEYVFDDELKPFAPSLGQVKEQTL